MITRASFLNLRTTTQLQSCGYKTVVHRSVDPVFEEEKRVYREEMSKMRKQHLKEYWERQTQVENTYLEKYQ